MTIALGKAGKRQRLCTGRFPALPSAMAMALGKGRDSPSAVIKARSAKLLDSPSAVIKARSAKLVGLPSAQTRRRSAKLFLLPSGLTLGEHCRRDVDDNVNDCNDVTARILCRARMSPLGKVGTREAERVGIIVLGEILRRQKIRRAGFA